jgi:uncharacterized iron-regulated membrane protein
MTAKKIIGNVHLILGLASGIIVFIIAITGCFYAFQEEIQAHNRIDMQLQLNEQFCRRQSSFQSQKRCCRLNTFTL